MGKRIYPLGGIMYWYCYEVEEICSLYRRRGIRLHPQTVLQWVKDGLPAIDKGKPFLIYGHALKAFLGKLNQSSKCKTEFDQMFCFKCREGRPPYRRQIALEPDGNGSVKAKARCQVCKKPMNKNYSRDDIPRLRSVFHVGDVLELCDSDSSAVNTHIPAYDETGVNESGQGELFPL